ncbi:MAG: NADH:ubiquinone oxidoreductase [Acidothermus sp.]|nr:NADH:ubiquinone oxidoreductase [Acidothermus sp.]
MPWISRGARVVTTRWPRRADQYADRFPATVSPTSAFASPEMAEVCPTGAIRVDDDQVRVDRGRCILCGRCVRHFPRHFRFTPGSEIARLARDALVVPELDETDGAVRAVRDELSARTRALRRSVHIRHIDVGSDGADEWEVLALLNPIYDVHRLGIFFTASPRHADILLVTGVGTRGMREPLARTLDALPRPCVVIAAGTDAISGGLVHPTYATHGGIADLVPVDVWVPGSPPTPFSLLHGILLAIGRMSS